MTVQQTGTRQTVDWADPAVQHQYLRLHRRDQWRTSRASLVALTLLTIIGVFQWRWLHRWGLLVGAVGLLGLVLLRIHVNLIRLGEFLPVSGDLTHYRLEGRTLHIQDTAGEYEHEYQIPLGEMGGFRSYPGGIVVQHAETFTFTLLGGPVRRELEHLLNAPGGTR
ncbi:hypothetical protein [Deinococcus sp.]|uniref:hypothetical protein n=1 Tax=Deinococcus sp. TaxID=47478 RepID=UPI003C7CF31E